MDLTEQFVIDSGTAESLARSLGVSTVADALPHLVPSARSLARPPISNFQVGAVALSSDGRIFLGVNLEFPGLPLNQSVHAEQFLLANASLHSSAPLLTLAVSAAPCGHCRQFFQELRSAPDLSILIADGGSLEAPSFRPLSFLLPHPFGPPDLLSSDHPLLLEPHRNRLLLLRSPHPHPDPDPHCNGTLHRHSARWSELRRTALEAADRAYAPYSGCPSGVALEDSAGRTFAGSYIESAAYNPSLAPLQAALVAFVVGGGGDYGEIVAAALVEKESVAVGQEAAARMVLGAVAPRCELRVFHCCACSDDGEKNTRSSSSDDRSLRSFAGICGGQVRCGG